MRKTVKKVLIVLYYYHPYVSGVSVCAKRVAEGFVEHGYEVKVLTSRFDKSLPKNEIINGVKIKRRPVIFKISKGVLMPTFLFDIILGSYGCDYVNFHLPMGESGFASLFIPRRKILTTYQCDIFLGDGIGQRFAAWLFMILMKLQLARSKVVIPSSMDYLTHSKMKRYVNKARPIYPTVPEEDFYPTDSKPLMKRLGVAKNDIRIGFVGRVVYEKGIQYLLSAIPYLAKELESFKVIIVGDYLRVAGGSIKEQLDHMIAKYPDNIIFTGFLSDSDRNRFYSGIDVLVLPSIDPLEAFGLVQIEAMLCGSPVVASDMPGVREAVKITQYGRLTKIKDPADIAKQILEVVNHADKYRPNREEVLKHFGKKLTLDPYFELTP